MRNAHIAFISTPIASHLNLTLPLASTLARRGYRLTYATSEPFRSRVEALGVEPIEFRFGAISTKVLDEQLYCRLATNMLAEITPFYEKNKPDLIMYDLVALAGRVLANRWKIPAIKTSPQVAFSKPFFHRQIEDQNLRERVLKKSGEASRFLRSYEIDESDFIFHRERLNIHLFSRDFEPCEDAIDETCFYAGRCAGEQRGFGHWHRRDYAGRPIVLIATSRSYMQGSGFFKMFMAAFSNLPWHVVLSVDDDADVESLGPLPANFEIVQRTSHTKILPYANMLVCMGGIAVVSEAAYHGVPMIITSLGIRELEWTADRVMKLGIGIHLKGAHLTVESLRQFSAEVLESSEILKRVKQLQYRILREAGAEEVANRIGEYLEETYSSARG